MGFDALDSAGGELGQRQKPPAKQRSTSHVSHCSCRILQDMIRHGISQIRVGAHPAFASSSEKVTTTQRPTHAEMMLDRIFLKALRH
jgi:hypothetical protein